MVPEVSENPEAAILSFLAESGDEYASGEALSGKLGLTKADVWKYVEALRHQGYRIDTVPARGYRLVSKPDTLSALELSWRLETHDIAQRVDYLAQVVSTNARAVEWALSGAPHGAVVIAETQTDGRGRRGRKWESPAGLNLYCSLVLRPDLPPVRAPELTLVGAVAVADALRGAGIEAVIKWPNDVCVGERKIAGLLTELAAERERVQHVVLGVGVNLNAGPSDFSPEVSAFATSLRQELGHPVDRAVFAAALFNRLEHWLDLHEEDGFAAIGRAWRDMATTLGTEVLVKMEGEELMGQAVDIDETGALLVLPAGAEKPVRVVAGDVQQMRRHAARSTDF
ncbi:MAG: biotin--[acetyl-CoA-carboxylase] ligase [Myxococcaceae bacterium]